MDLGKYNEHDSDSFFQRSVFFEKTLHMFSLFTYNRKCIKKCIKKAINMFGFVPSRKKDKGNE